ncbi:MAG: DUF1570 domain-containing protein [Planctomycetota bacterium]
MIRSTLFATVVLLLAAKTAPAEGSGSAEFEKRLLQSESLMSRGKWRNALDDLLLLVEEHAREPYVYLQRTRIEEDVLRCAFQAQHDLPEIGELISGKLLSYDRRTGKIKLLYDHSENSLADFSSAAGKLIHPLLFDGPYSVEIRGSNYPTVSGFHTGGEQKPPTVLCGFENDEFYLISFGFERRTIGNTVYHHQAYIGRARGDDVKVLDEKDSTPCKSGKKYSIKVSVGKTQLNASFNGQTFLKGPKSKQVFGTVALENLSGWDEIILEGDAQTSWVQQIEDLAAVKLRAEFEKSYDKTAFLPDWFFKDPPAERSDVSPAVASASSSQERRYPGEETAKQDGFFKIAMAHINRGDYERGLEYLESLGDEVSEGVRCYLQAQSHAGLGNSKEALALCDRVAALDPGFLGTQRLRLELLLAGDDPDQAEAQLLALIQKLPDDADLHRKLVRKLFGEGRLEEAHEQVRLALGKGIRDEELSDFDRYLTIAAKGPNWSKTYEHESRNYRVVSDIDVATCREASQLLESAYATYSTRLKPVSGLERRKFMVFLFSGQAGYESHVQRVLGGLRPFQSAGVYSGNLKQLFIWNQRDREAMLTTVRHEGFHQYFDRVTSSSPTWFNEGLAEYYEVGDAKGSIHEYNLETLREAKSLVPLKEFVFMDHEAFYRGSSLHYAEGWAFVHFLRHHKREGGRRFQELFGLLTRNVPADVALNRVFSETDWQELDDRFQQYVEGL